MTLLVAVVCAAVVASVLTVTAVTGPYDVSGKRIELAADEIAYTPGRNLSSWTHTPSEDPAKATTYDWDKNNNRLSATVDSDTTEWSYRRDNSISTVEPAGTSPNRDYTYDNAGLLTDDGCNESTYDAFDRVEKVDTDGSAACGGDSKSTEYTYDGLDRQRNIEVSGSSTSGANVTTRNIYDGITTSLTGQTDAVNAAHNSPDVLYQLDSTGTAIALEQTGGGSAAGKTFLDTDGNGNVTTLVAGGNSVDCSVAYDPFGNPLFPDGDSVCKSGSGSEGSGNSLWYRGQSRDGSTGNYQLGARTYDPATGAFTSPDTYRVGDSDTDVSVGVDPLTANTYSYVNGNPVNLRDADGHYPTCSDSGREACDRPPSSPAAKEAQDRYLKKQTAKNTVQRKSVQQKVEEPFDWVGQGAQFLGDVTGINDVKDCVLQGDIKACLWSVSGIGLAAITKAGKAVKGVKGLNRAYKAYERAKDGARATLRNIDAADARIVATLRANASSRVVKSTAALKKRANSALPSRRTKHVARGDTPKPLAKPSRPTAANTGRLTSRADELSDALDPIARNSRTSAALGTRQGTDVLAGGGRDLSPVQRALARDGDIIARGPGLHAEVTAVTGARSAGLTPQGIGVSRPICPACISFLEDAGATITGPNSAWWY